MEITSIVFFVFLIISLFLYYKTKDDYKWITILIISLFFICSFNILGIVFIFLSSSSIWLAGKKMGTIVSEKWKKRVVIISICFNN